jgi:cell division protein FtsI/penicillin-binding protein 2
LNRNSSKYIPRLIKRGVDFKFIAWYEENADELSGVNYVTDTERDYKHGVRGAHMFGYIREISQEQLKLKRRISNGDILALPELKELMKNI